MQTWNNIAWHFYILMMSKPQTFWPSNPNPFKPQIFWSWIQCPVSTICSYFSRPVNDNLLVQCVTYRYQPFWGQVNRSHHLLWQPQWLPGAGIPPQWWASAGGTYEQTRSQGGYRGCHQSVLGSCHASPVHERHTLLHLWWREMVKMHNIVSSLFIIIPVGLYHYVKSTSEVIRYPLWATLTPWN